MRLLAINSGRLRIGDVDVLDDTPLLDIKPYAPSLACFKVHRVGWLENKGAHGVVADDRFERKSKTRQQP